MIPVSDGPREVRCSSPVIILGGDPPAAGPLHRDGRDHAVVPPADLTLAAGDGLHLVLLCCHLDAPRAPLGPLLSISNGAHHDTAQAKAFSASISREGGGRFHGGQNKQNVA